MSKVIPWSEYVPCKNCDATGHVNTKVSKFINGEWVDGSWNDEKCIKCKGVGTVRGKKTTVSGDIIHDSPKSRPMLWNWTKYDSDLLMKLAVAALDRAECKRNIHIYLIPSKERFHGVANRAMIVRVSRLVPRREPRGIENNQYRTNQGYYRIFLPTIPRGYVYGGCVLEERGATLWARKIYGMMVHESKHVADFQNNQPFGDYGKRWKNRPHEKRAITTEAGAYAELDRGEKPEIMELINLLAVNLQDKVNGRVKK